MRKKEKIMRQTLKIIILAVFLIQLSCLNAEKSRSEIVKELFESVEEWMGTPYIYGGASKTGIDCSGFTGKVYEKVFGISLPRSVRAQKEIGEIVTDKLQPGDLLFFNIDGSISHVGIFVFGDKFIHAASAGPNLGVVKCSLEEKYYKERYAFAKRLIKLPAYQKEEEEKGEPEINDIKKTEEPEIIPGNSAEINMGLVVLNGCLTDISEKFTGSDTIYYEVKNNNSKFKTFKITITSLDAGSTKDLYLFGVTEGSRQNGKIQLKNKGKYKISLITGRNKIAEKIIEIN